MKTLKLIKSYYSDEAAKEFQAKKVNKLSKTLEKTINLGKPAAQSKLFSHPADELYEKYPNLFKQAIKPKHKTSFALLFSTLGRKDLNGMENPDALHKEMLEVGGGEGAPFLQKADGLHRFQTKAYKHPAVESQGIVLPSDHNINEYSDRADKNKNWQDKYSTLGKSISDEDNEDMIASIAVMTGGEILIGKRIDCGLYTLPGGHAKQGENIIEAALRELREETGIKARQEDLVYLGHERVTPREGGKITVHSFLLNEKEKTNTSHDPDEEVDRWEWIDVKNGLPKHILNNLHAKKNITLRMLDLQPFEDEIKKSFFNPLELTGDMEEFDLPSASEGLTEAFNKIKKIFDKLKTAV